MPKELEFYFKDPNNSPGYLLGQVTMLWQRKQKKVFGSFKFDTNAICITCGSSLAFKKK